MTDLPPAGYLSDASRDVGEMKQALEDIVAAIRELIGGDAEESRTISAGVITPTRASVVVDTEAGVAADDLDQISTVNFPNGRTILIRSTDASRVVTVRHAQGGAGQIHLVDGANLSLSSPTQWLWLIRRGNDWHEVARSYGNNKAGALAFLGALSAQRTITAGAGLSGGGDLSADRTLSVIVPLGQCRLTLDSGNLLLSRHNGRFLFIAGALYEIPEAGVTLPPTGLIAGQLYYIYAYMDGGVMKLEPSTTPPAVASAYGNVVKGTAGGEAYTLVGMARTVTGPAWVDSDAQRLVLSYFNRRAKPVVGAHTNGATTTSTGAVELTTAARAEFLTWGDEAVSIGIAGSASNSSAGFSTFARVGLDGSAVGMDSKALSSGVNGAHSHNARHTALLSAGYHYATPMGSVDGGTGTFLLQVHAIIMG